MNEYRRLLKLLNYYIQTNDVETNDEIISAFDLYTMLNERLSDLKNISSKLKEKFMKDNTVIVRKGFFSKKTIEEQKQKCDVWFTAHKFISIIRFFYGDNIFTDSINNYSMVVLTKNKNCSKINFEEKDKDIVKMYFNEFLEIFTKMEEYTDLFSESNDNDYYDEVIMDIASKEYIQTFVNDFFEINVIYNNAGEVNVNISIKEDIDRNRISLMEPVEDKSIQTIIDENKELLLRKVSINTNDLDKTSKKIFDEQKSKVKTLRKNANNL